MAKAWSATVRTALPGPWGARPVAREAVGALVLAGLAWLVETVTDSGFEYVAPIAVVLLFLLRRGLPAGVLVVTAAMAGLMGGPMLLLVCVGWSAGARITRVWVLIASFSAAFALMTAIGVAKDAASVPPKLLFGLSLGGFLLLAVLPALWGRYRAQRRALTDALRDRNEQLLRERAMVAHQARLRERHRIAQDMHDSLGHQLALISVHSGALEVDRTLTDRQREAVGVLRLAAVAAMRELREVVGLLHDESTATPPAGAVAGVRPAEGGAGTAPATRGGVSGIAGLVESSRAAGTEVTLTRDGEQQRTPAAAVDHAAYRIVQEALTNAHKHAPGAPITVALRYEPDALVVEVANAPAPVAVGVGGAGGPGGADGSDAAGGPGRATARPRASVSGGQGLTGLRERARLVGGMLHAGSTPDGGFRLAAVLPYDGTADPSAEKADPVAADLPDDDLAPFLPPPPGGTARRRGRSPVIAFVVGGVVVLLAVLGLIAWGVVSLVRVTVDATVARPLYDSITVGQSEADVRRRLPPGNNIFTRDYDGTGPNPPAGSVCSHYLHGDGAGGWNEERVARFCFKDGVLVEKIDYRTKT